MYCPQCRSEYRDGFVECHDCRVELVDELPLLLETEEEAAEDKRDKDRGWMLIGIGFAVQWALRAIAQAIPNGLMANVAGLFFFITGWALVVGGCMYVARSKGYSPSAGLIGILNLVGVIGVALLPRKEIRERRKKRETTPSYVPPRTSRKASAEVE